MLTFKTSARIDLKMRLSTFTHRARFAALFTHICMYTYNVYIVLYATHTHTHALIRIACNNIIIPIYCTDIHVLR